MRSESSLVVDQQVKRFLQKRFRIKRLKLSQSQDHGERLHAEVLIIRSRSVHLQIDSLEVTGPRNQKLYAWGISPR